LGLKGKVLGRKLLGEIGSFFTPDTILRWHRQLVAAKWDHSNKRKPVGRPATSLEIIDLILQFARDNPTWGYDRIADALANLGHEISDQTVGNVLKEHGIEPAPDRKRTTSWATFLKTHWDQLAAIDFTTVEVWTTSGLVTYHLLFAMHLATRRVQLVGCTTNPGGLWMLQMARNLTDAVDGFLRQPIRYLLLDRDTKFTAAFQALLQVAGVEPVLLPPRSPNCNAFLERFFRSLKDEALDRMIFFSEEALRPRTTASCMFVPCDASSLPLRLSTGSSTISGRDSPTKSNGNPVPALVFPPVEYFDHTPHAIFLLHICQTFFEGIA